MLSMARLNSSDNPSAIVGLLNLLSTSRDAAAVSQPVYAIRSSSRSIDADRNPAPELPAAIRRILSSAYR